MTMKLPHPLLGSALALVASAWPSSAKEQSRKPAIVYGAQMTGTFSGGEAKKNVFIKYDNDSEWTFWLLTRSCFRIDIYRLLKDVPMDNSKSSITIKGRVLFVTSKGQQHLLRRFSETVQINRISNSSTIFKPSPLYIQLNNDGSLQEKKTDGPYTDLVIEVESPTNFKFVVSQPQPWGGD